MGVPTPEKAERAVFLELRQKNYEMMAFPTWFPFGGDFSQKRPTSLRYEEYVRYLLRKSTFAWLKHDLWLQDVALTVVVLRPITGLPPMYEDRQKEGGRKEATTSGQEMVARFKQKFPQKLFSIRYLVGDEEFANLVPIMVQNILAEGERAEMIGEYACWLALSIFIALSMFAS